MRLTGHRVLVVGVGVGLGPATVYMLLKDGATVVMASRTRERLDEVKRQLKSYGTAEYVTGDASKMAEAETIVNEAFKMMGRIDDLVILAGSYADSPIESLSEDTVNIMVDTNMRAPLYIMKSAMKYLKENSSVVMVSSVFGTYAPGNGNVAYAAAKAGVAKITETLSNELLKKKIRVNAVAPRAMGHEFEPDRDWRSSRNLGDIECPPEDVASVITWLLTDESAWINGDVIAVDGGRKK